MVCPECCTAPRPRQGPPPIVSEPTGAVQASTDDRDQALAVDIDDAVPVVTKLELARRMLTRALEAGVAWNRRDRARQVWLAVAIGGLVQPAQECDRAPLTAGRPGHR
jgi:hypothetical protein